MEALKKKKEKGLHGFKLYQVFLNMHGTYLNMPYIFLTGNLFLMLLSRALGARSVAAISTEDSTLSSCFLFVRQGTLNDTKLISILIYCSLPTVKPCYDVMLSVQSDTDEYPDNNKAEQLQFVIGFVGAWILED